MTSDLRAPKKIFISYARSDGEVFAISLRKRLEGEGLTVWQDRTSIEAGLNFWSEIEKAIHQADFLILVATPAAQRSEYMRKEWELAKTDGVRVIPVIGAPGVDFSQMPRWMRDSNFIDVYHPDQWETLLQTLRLPIEKIACPNMAEELPPDYVPRPEVMRELISLLVDPQQGDRIALTAALRGTGGFGKTILARALCHDSQVRQHFHEGILWITLGENPDLVGRLEDLICILSGKRSGFTTVEAARTRFAELIKNRYILLVIDDVWQESDAAPFLQGGAHCTRLITTRNEETLPPGTKQIKVPVMQREEGVSLLSFGLPSHRDREELYGLAKRLGYWPLLLKLVNGVLRDRSAAVGLPAALEFVNQTLSEEGLTAFDPRKTMVRDLAVEATLRVSLKQLSDDQQKRYAELSIFPEDVEIPLAILEKLWGITSGMKPKQVEKLCERLDDLSLLLKYDRKARVIRLHDVIREYLQKPPKVDLVETHKRLLDAVRPPRWAELPNTPRYLWEHLTYHLIQAGRGAEVVEMVKDLYYLTRKTSLLGSYSAENDLRQAAIIAPNDKMITLLRRSFTASAHLYGTITLHKDIGGTLHSRIQHLTELRTIVDKLAADLSHPFLTVHHTPPDLARQGLVRALSGHRDVVNACGIASDGKFVVSASSDRTLKVWDPVTGKVRQTLSGHKSAVLSCVVFRAARAEDLIVSGSADKTLRIWGAHNGITYRTLEGHQGAVKSCAVTPDGTLIVSASADKTVRIWDAVKGTQLHLLKGHQKAVNACAVSSDGKWAASASDDGTLRLWNLSNGAMVRTFDGHDDPITCCAFSPNGQNLLSGAEDGTVRVWDVQTGAEKQVIKAHSEAVQACAYSANGSLILSASLDQTVRTWHATTGAHCTRHVGHTGGVMGCVFFPDGKAFISASEDTSLRLWVIQSGGERLIQNGHTGDVTDCAISPDGKYALSTSTDHTLRLWEVESGREIRTLSGHTTAVRACAISPDGTRALSGADDGSLILWDLSNGTSIRTLNAHTSWVRACAFSPQGDLIISCGDDNKLKVWEADTGKLSHTLPGHKDWVTDCAFSPTGDSFVSASKDKTVILWNANTGAEIKPFKGHSAPVMGVKFTPDGKTIIAAAKADLRFWEIVSGTFKDVRAAHSGHISDFTISADGKHVVTVAQDNCIKLWELRSGEYVECAALYVDSPLNACAFNPDGVHLVAVGGRGVYFLKVVN